MTRLREILRDRKGNGFPLAIAITLALVIIFCGISEYINRTAYKSEAKRS